MSSSDPFARWRRADLPSNAGKAGKTVRSEPEPEAERGVTAPDASNRGPNRPGEARLDRLDAAAPGREPNRPNRSPEPAVRSGKAANPAKTLGVAPNLTGLTDLTGIPESADSAGAPAPLAPPAPRDLPEPPRPGAEPVTLTAEDLAPVPGSPHADLEADWRASLARARERFAAHGGAPGGREAHKFVRDAATLECLILGREREFAAWRERWRATLEGVYAGKVALLPGFERDLLATWRTKVSAEAIGPEHVVCQHCGAAFARPADLPLA